MWSDRRALLAIVAASLLFNVFLGGAVLGRVFGEHRAATPKPPAAAGPLVPPAHVQALPAEDRRTFRQAMAPHRPAIRAAREAHRAARRRIEADIAAPSFDQTKITADFEALRQTNRDIDEAVDSALIDALSQLPSQSRAALVTHAQNERPARPAQP